MEQTKRTTQLLLIIIGGILLPILSICLSSKASMLYENLTYVGNLTNKRPLFIIWGILQSLMYCLFYFKISQGFKIKNIKTNILVYTITIISIIAFLLPYKNHSGDLLSQLHVYGSMVSCIITYLIVFHIIYKISYFDYLLFQKLRNFITIILTLFALCIIILGDISTLSELILLNGLNYLFIYILIHNKRIPQH